MLVHDKTGVTNVVQYGFMHNRKNAGYVIWKMAPLRTTQCAVTNDQWEAARKINDKLPIGQAGPWVLPAGAINLQ